MHVKAEDVLDEVLEDYDVELSREDMRQLRKLMRRHSLVGARGTKTERKNRRDKFEEERLKIIEREEGLELLFQVFLERMRFWKKYYRSGKTS